MGRFLLFGMMAVCLFGAGCNSEKGKTEAENDTQGKSSAPSEKSPSGESNQMEKIAATKETIKNIENAANAYAIDHDGELPESLDELTEEQMVRAELKPPYLEQEAIDAWGTRIHYATPLDGRQRQLITSFGPNQKAGGGDDITNLDDDPNFSPHLETP